MDSDNHKQLHETLKIILTFKHLKKDEVVWIIKELHRRFNFPIDALIKIFKEEGFDERLL